jgi:hypothetical protein
MSYPFYLHCLCRALIYPGFKIEDLSNSVVEIKIPYDGSDIEDPICGINRTYNAKRKCDIEFEAPEDMEPPILIHYELTNFHQNHKNYYQSRDPYQLLGRPYTQQNDVEAKFCAPLNKLGNIYLNPCGLIANTFFNDIFRLKLGNDTNGDPLEMLEEGIAWASDVEYKYDHPRGFRMELCEYQPGDGTCDQTCCSIDTEYNGEQVSWNCDEPAYNEKDNNCYRYHYPDKNVTQYLYQTYPDVISPLEGVTNEHFIVWMRVATLPTFRKLYGYIEQPIQKGTKFVIEVESNYVVESFKGSKSIMVSTNNIFGGKNPVLGPSFIGVGFFCIGAAVFFTLKHWLRPRKLADRRYLHFKED